MPTVPFHAPGITYNGLHSTETRRRARSAPIWRPRQHFDVCGPITLNTAGAPWMWARSAGTTT